jgi:hypothetical protein
MGHGLFAWMDGHEDVGPFSFTQTAKFLRDHFKETEDIEKLITAVEEMIASHPLMGQRPPEVGLLCNCHKPALIAAIRMWFQPKTTRGLREVLLLQVIVCSPSTTTSHWNRT